MIATYQAGHVVMAKQPQQTRVKPADQTKRQMLLHLDSDVIKDLKKAAVDRESSASSIANEAIDEWLKKHALRSA
jgi:hypothetical protein